MEKLHLELSLNTRILPIYVINEDETISLRFIEVTILEDYFLSIRNDKKYYLFNIMISDFFQVDNNVLSSIDIKNIRAQLISIIGEKLNFGNIFKESKIRFYFRNLKSNKLLLKI